MMTASNGNILHITGPLWGKSTGHWWMPPTKASDVELWHDQMETFSALLALCVGNSPVTGEFPSQRPVTQSFDVFFDLSLNKQLSKQSRCWWFEMPLHWLWHHCYDKDRCRVMTDSRFHWYRGLIFERWIQFVWNPHTRHSLATMSWWPVRCLLACSESIVPNFILAVLYGVVILHWEYIDGLVQKRRNSSALALKLRLSCTNPLISYCRI